MRSDVIQTIRYYGNILKSFYRFPSCSWGQGLRMYERWKKSITVGWGGGGGSFLWKTLEAQDFIETILKAEWKVFEYGSGRSSLFYSERVSQLISVEHDQGYYEKSRQFLENVRITNCDLRLRVPECGGIQNQDCSNPKEYASADKMFRGCCFLKYVQEIDAFPDESFNLVAIDGRARPSCVLHACKKVKKGGWLMLDDSERSYYGRAKLLLNDWERHSFYGPGPQLTFFWETTFWRKPEK